MSCSRTSSTRTCSRYRVIRPLGWAGLLQLTRIETESSATAVRSCTVLGAIQTEQHRRLLRLLSSWFNNCYNVIVLRNNVIVISVLSRQIFEDQANTEQKSVVYTFWRCGYFILGCWTNFTSSFGSHCHCVSRVRGQTGECKSHVCRAVLIQVT